MVSIEVKTLQYWIHYLSTRLCTPMVMLITILIYQGVITAQKFGTIHNAGEGSKDHLQMPRWHVTQITLQ